MARLYFALLFVTFFWTMFFIPGKAYAGLCTPAELAKGYQETDLFCAPSDPVSFVQKFYGIGLAFVGAVSLIAIMIGGYNILTSRGDPQRVNAGKSWIFYAIGGLLLAIFGYVIIETITAGILKIPGFSE